MTGSPRMTRDDLEASIWRLLGLQATATRVDAILEAADLYAITLGGITAERRRQLQQEGSSRVKDTRPVDRPPDRRRH